MEAAAAQGDAVFDASDLMPSSIGLAVIALSVFMKKDASLREKGAQFGQRSAQAGVSAGMGKVTMVVTQTWWIELIGGVATSWLAGGWESGNSMRRSRLRWRLCEYFSSL